MTDIEARQIVELAERLRNVPGMSETDSSSEPQSYVTAYAIADIARCLRRFQTEILPIFLDQSRCGEELRDALLDMGEELRHIIDHAKEMKHFAYLFDT